MPEAPQSKSDPVRAYFGTLPFHQQLNAVGANLEVARMALLEAAKKADAAHLPVEFHRDLLFSMDHMRELEQSLAEIAEAVR